MKLGTGVRDPSEPPGDFRETPIGATLDVSKAILGFPGSRESGEGHINIETVGYSIEIRVGKENVCTGIMFFVYGDGSRAVEVIRTISERLAIRAWDINGAQ